MANLVPDLICNPLNVMQFRNRAQFFFFLDYFFLACMCICESVIGRCPVEYMKRWNKTDRWDTYHKFLTGIDDKNNSIGYSWTQAYYNLQDSGKCNEHFRNIMEKMDPDTRLPLWQLHFVNGSQELAYLQMQEMDVENLKLSTQGGAPETPSSMRLSEQGWTPHEVLSFGPHFKQKQLYHAQNDYFQWSESMQLFCEREAEDSNVWVCTLPGCRPKGRRMGTDHWKSKSHLNAMKNENCKLGDQIVYAWKWTENGWEDITNPPTQDEQPLPDIATMLSYGSSTDGQEAVPTTPKVLGRDAD